MSKQSEPLVPGVRRHWSREEVFANSYQYVKEMQASPDQPGAAGGLPVTQCMDGAHLSHSLNETSGASAIWQRS